MHPSRQAVVDAALSQEGVTDPSPYWLDVLGQVPARKYSWCRIFAKWCLHQAGLARQYKWVPGVGWEAKHMPTTRDPQPGDIAYREQFQHGAIVVSVDGENIVTVDGNSRGGKVTVNQSARDKWDAFYSIERLLNV